MKPEALLEIKLKTTEEGGRKSPIQGQYFGCPVRLDGEYFDCRLIVENRTLELGNFYRVPVVFLHPELVLPKLYVGKTITLWEGRDIGVGTIISIL